MGLHKNRGVSLMGSWWISIVTTKVIFYYLGLPNYFDELSFILPGVFYGQ